MNVTPDVINDLLPLYEAGDASPDSCALVQEFLRQNPDYATQLKERNEGARQMLNSTIVSPSINLPPNHEKETLLRTKKLIQKRSYLLAMSVMFTAIPLASTVQAIGEHGFSGTSFLGRDAVANGLFWFLALIGWSVFFMANRELKNSGL